MACIPLMEDQRQPLYFPLIDSPTPPSVEGLQRWLEKAWEAGPFRSVVELIKEAISQIFDLQDTIQMEQPTSSISSKEHVNG